MIRGYKIPLVFAVIFITIGLAFLIYALYEAYTEVATGMEQNSYAFKAYVNPPVPSYQMIYVFNLTNYDDVVRGANPAVKELGPYAFRMSSRKSATWSSYLLQISDTTTYYFEPSLSNGSLDDTVVSLNVYMMSLLNARSPTPEARRKLSDKTLFFNVTIRELFYGGYDDRLQGWRLSQLPDELLSYFRAENGSTKTYEVYTGQEGHSKETNVFFTWNRNRHLSYLEGVCNQLEGTNGEFYQPTLDPPASVRIFRQSLCKPWTLHLNERFIYSGEPLVRYHGKGDLYNETGDFVLDSCFSSVLLHKSGIFDAGRCYSILRNQTTHNRATILSYPHFLFGDPQLVKNIMGLRPDEFRHKFYLDVHAKSGLVVDMRRRTQYSFLLKPTPSEAKIPQVIYPIFWEEILRLPEDRNVLLSGLKSQLPAEHAAIIAVLSFVLGMVCVIIILVIWKKRHSKKAAAKSAVVPPPSMKEEEFAVASLPNPSTPKDPRPLPIVSKTGPDEVTSPLGTESMSEATASSRPESGPAGSASRSGGPDEEGGNDETTETDENETQPKSEASPAPADFKPVPILRTKQAPARVRPRPILRRPSYAGQPPPAKYPQAGYPPQGYPPQAPIRAPPRPAGYAGAPAQRPSSGYQQAVSGSKSADPYSKPTKSSQGVPAQAPPGYPTNIPSKGASMPGYPAGPASSGGTAQQSQANAPPRAASAPPGSNAPSQQYPISQQSGPATFSPNQPPYPKAYK